MNSSTKTQVHKGFGAAFSPPSFLRGFGERGRGGGVDKGSVV